MTDTPRIEGTPDPRKSSQLSSDDPVDTEKFKRMLRVEDTDEAQKQHKRRKPKKTEEEDEVENEEALHNTPKDASFAAIFGAQKTEDDLFAKKAGEKPAIQVSSALSLSHLHLTLKKNKKDPKIFPTLNLEEALPQAFKHERAKISDLELTPLPINTQEPPLIPIAENAPLNLNENPSFADIRKHEHEEDKAPSPFIHTELTQALPITPPLLSTESPAYTHLSSDLFEFYEKMIGLLMIEECKGISITTIKLSMPGSVFNDCEIKLEHFDTAPHAFNVQLLGNPQAVDLFNANFSNLASSFAQGNYKFQVHLRRPILLDSYHKLTKKGSSPYPQESDQNQDETAV